jgi:hypothetical protein
MAQCNESTLVSSDSFAVVWRRRRLNGWRSVGGLL